MDIMKFMKIWRRGFPFRGLSIQQRLPFFICLLLLCVMITFSWISYIAVKNAELKTGKERLRSLTDQVSSMFSQSAQTFLSTAKAAVNQDPIKKYLQTGGSELKPELLEILKKLRPDSTTVLVDLLDMNKHPVLRSGKDSIQEKINFDSLLSVSSPIHSDSAAVGKICEVKHLMYYSIIVPIIDNKQAIGYLVRWRLLTASPNAIKQFSKIMGTNATLYIGNEDGSLWTDMLKHVSNPIPGDTVFTHDMFEYSDARGNKLLGSSKHIANTPWLVLVEFSKKTILEAAHSFLQWMIIAAAVLICISFFIAWIMTHNIIGPLNKLTVAASAIADGNYSPTVAVERRDEVGKLARAFNAMTGQVSKARNGLEQKVTETENVNEQLRSLSAHLQNIREEERIHIAREMHDELGQLLTGFKMDVSWLKNKITKSEIIDVQKKLEDMMGIIDDAVNFVRKLAAELRPGLLDDLGLIPALEWHSHEFEKRYTIKTEFHSQVQDLKVSSFVATGLYRMYQESLTNVARHSDAKKVVASLQLTTKEIRLSITDDGKGFDPAQGERKTLGLLGMKERAIMIGGNLEIKTKPGEGTSIVIKVPVTSE
jgi:signal transduction histidine kinase